MSWKAFGGFVAIMVLIIVAMYTLQRNSAGTASNAIPQAEQERSRQPTTAVKPAQQPETECDRIATRVTADMVGCIGAIDPAMGKRLADTVAAVFRDRPQFRLQAAAQDPHLIESFNRECSERWLQIRAQLPPERLDLRACIPADL